MAAQRTNAFSPASCRAARGLLDLTQEALGKRAGISRLTVADFEKGRRTPTQSSSRAMRDALEAGGVAFVPGGAVLRASTRPEPIRLDAVLRALREGADRLRRLGVRHASVFGSVARGEAGANSDVDVMIELDPALRLDLFDYAEISAEIAALLAPASADVASKASLKPHVAEEALRDAVNAF